MALVVFLRGVNVGGHKTFRPAALAKELKDLDVVNIGAAGTFVIRRPITRTRLRAEFTRRLPFDAEIMICDRRDIVRLVARDPFAGQSVGPDIVPFVSVLARPAKPPRSSPPTPIRFPAAGTWLLQVLGTDEQFIFGVYRRQMKAVGYLGKLDRLFGCPVTTRNWNTINAIAKVLG
jgi:uncharacterized protein (DUF1697 family)